MAVLVAAMIVPSFYVVAIDGSAEAEPAGPPVAPAYENCGNANVEGGAAGLEARAPDRTAIGQVLVVQFSKFPLPLVTGGEFLGARIRSVYAPLCYAVVETTEPERFVARASALPEVVSVDKSRGLRASSATNDPSGERQWGLHMVRAPLAWDSYGFGTHQSIVCIIDNGLVKHSDYLANYLGGTDLIQGDSDPFLPFGPGDPLYYDVTYGHGTRIAGIIAAGVNNGKGIAGVGNLGFKFVRANYADAFVGTDQLIQAIDWCKNNADVISMSLGGEEYIAAEQNAVNAAWNAGKILVAAAGNSGCQCVEYPAGYDHVIGVSCYTIERKKCPSSNGGAHVDVAAPGRAIYSTDSAHANAYELLARSSGATSFSTPYVAAAAAYTWSRWPGLLNQQVVDRILNGAQPLPGSSTWHGRGLVDVAAAVAGGDAWRNPPTSCFDPEPDLALYACSFTWQSVGYLDLERPELVEFKKDLKPAQTPSQFSGLAIGFPFYWYGVVRTEVTVGTNGLVCFVPTDNCGSTTPTSHPSPTTPPMDHLACFWNKLNVLPPSTGIFYASLPPREGTGQKRVFVVEFRNVPHEPNDGSNTFQIQLFEDHSAKCAYLSVSEPEPGRPTKAGTEGLVGATGLSYAQSNFRTFGTEVEFASPFRTPLHPPGGANLGAPISTRPSACLSREAPQGSDWSEDCYGYVWGQEPCLGHSDRHGRNGTNDREDVWDPSYKGGVETVYEKYERLCTYPDNTFTFCDGYNDYRQGGWQPGEGEQEDRWQGGEWHEYCAGNRDPSCMIWEAGGDYGEDRGRRETYRDCEPVGVSCRWGLDLVNRAAGTNLNCALL